MLPMTPKILFLQVRMNEEDFTMAEISKITLPSGSTYDIKDETARNLISELTSSTSYLGVTTTAITDGATTSPVTIGDQSVTPKSGDIVGYGNSEFIWSGVENKWREFGSTGSLKALAFKDSASGSFTPAGTVAAPTVTVTPNTASIKPFGSAGSLPSFSATVADETLTLAFSAGALPSAGNAVTAVTGIKSATATAPKFTGTAGNVTVK